MSTDNSENSLARRSLVSINRELRKRLTRAGRMLEERKLTIERLSAQVTGAPEVASGGSEQYVRLTRDIQKVESDLAEAKRTNEALRRENEQLKEGYEIKVSELSEELVEARNHARSLEREIASSHKSSEVSSISAQSGLWNELARASMHVAGLEAQISAMRLENAHSALLQTDEGSEKSRLRQIYDEAYLKRGRQFGQKEGSASRGKAAIHATSN